MLNIHLQNVQFYSYHNTKTIFRPRISRTRPSFQCLPPGEPTLYIWCLFIQTIVPQSNNMPYKYLELNPAVGFRAVCHFGTMPRLVQIETSFFGTNLKKVYIPSPSQEKCSRQKNCAIKPHSPPPFPEAPKRFQFD